MKRILVALLLVASFSTATAVSAGAESSFAGDPGSRPCADFNNGTANYTTFNGAVPPSVFVTIDVQAAPCHNVNYTVTVYPDSGTTSLGSSTPQSITNNPGGTATIQFQGVPTGTTNDVCVVATATEASATLDQAPTSPTGSCLIGIETVFNGGIGAINFH